MSINARSEAGLAITDLATDLWVRRDGVLLTRARVMVPRHSLTADAHVMAVDAKDYTAILERRLLVAGDAALVNNDVDQAEIAWRLVNASQSRSGGALGITKGTNGFDGGGVADTGVLRDRNDWEPGDSCGKRLADLAAVDDGFDYEVTGARTLEVYYPAKGTNAGLILDYGGRVAEVDLTGNPGGFDNVVFVEGSDQTTPVYSASAGIATDPRGRWEGSFSYSTVTEQTTLTEKATGLLAERGRPPRSYKLKLRRGWWPGLSVLDTGDTVRVVINSGPLQVAALARVMELSVAVDESGGEDVTVTVEES